MAEHSRQTQKYPVDTPLMPRRPKILLLTIHSCCMPGGGGTVRSHFFTRVAASLGDVTLVSLAGATGQKVPEDIHAICERVIETPGGSAPRSFRFLPQSLLPLVNPHVNAWRDFVGSCLQHLNPGRNSQASASLLRRLYVCVLRAELRLLQTLGCLPPWSSLAWFSHYRQLRSQILAAAEKSPFDVIWVEDVLSWPYASDLRKFPGLKSTQIICNSYNIEYSLAERIAASVPNPDQSQFHRDLSLQLMRMEKEAYNCSAQTFVCSPNDGVLAHELAPHGRFSVIGNGVDLKYFSRGSAPPATDAPNSTPMLLLTGTFGYAPNQHAASFFARNILPLIRHEIPNAAFLIAGSNAAALKREFGTDGIDIDADSDPADIRPSFLRAAVFVVPLLSGGGTRLKILEAMAMGVPVVSTTIGAEGLGAVHGQHLLVADSPEDFALAVIQLLRDRDFANHITETASSWVQANFGWDKLCQKAAAVVAPLLQHAQEQKA